MSRHAFEQSWLISWLDPDRAGAAQLDANLFISGHGAPVTRAELEVRLALAVQRRAEIARRVAGGQTLAQIKEALHDTPLPGNAVRFPAFMETT